MSTEPLSDIEFCVRATRSQSWPADMGETVEQRCRRIEAALPIIRRALARDAAIEEMDEDNCNDTRDGIWEAAGWNNCLRELRAITGEQGAEGA